MDSKVIRAVVPMLAVSDMSRALAFYERLGFASHRYQGGDGYAFLHREDWQVHLTQSDTASEGSHPGSGIYFYLTDGHAAQLLAEFRDRGISILSPLFIREWKMNEFVLADPDGNLLRFGESADAGMPAPTPATSRELDPAVTGRGVTS